MWCEGMTANAERGWTSGVPVECGSLASTARPTVLPDRYMITIPVESSITNIFSMMI